MIHSIGPSAIIPLKDSYCGKTYQAVVDNKLHIVVVIPGIDRASLKVRSKSDTVAISAEYNDLLKKFLEEQIIDIRITVVREINVLHSQAIYKDGVLHLEFALAKATTH